MNADTSDPDAAGTSRIAGLPSVRVWANDIAVHRLHLLGWMFTTYCVACQSNAGWACTDGQGKPIRRPHLRRVLTWLSRG